MKKVLFNSENDFIKKSLDLIKELSGNSEFLDIALSGGSTPLALYQAIAKDPISQKINFSQVDERYVPHDDKESNYKLIIESGIQLAHFFDTNLPISDCLNKYEFEIQDLVFDLMVLGIGSDGHTASLFPSIPELDSDHFTAHTQTNEFAVKDRLTLTFAKIMESKNLLVLLNDKPGVLEELGNPTKSDQEFPAHRLKEHKNLVIHYLK